MGLLGRALARALPAVLPAVPRRVVGRVAGHDNVGIVLQARLRRTLDDAHALAELKPDVRLCKGIYVEPVAAGSRLALATHDEWLLGESLHRVGGAGLGPDGYEVQMLLGVREERASQLVADGQRVTSCPLAPSAR